MDAIYYWLNSLLNKNKSEFATWAGINWANTYTAGEYQRQRDTLLEKAKINLLFKDTKPYLNHISQGCEICASGKWSCLFITSKCNANCFYCPAPQANDEKPSTQGLDFDDPVDYADYINHFRFKGVSFSGGEPLLYYERTLEYLKTLRNKCSDDVYIWMYTNGRLADKNRLKALAGENLNEIRFDIGAVGFNLDRIKNARGIIPNITIEIPSIPEEKHKIIELIPDMVKAGVTNLNLHHLRLTKHNADNLVKRGYTIIGEERPLVMESEIAALEIINEVKAKGFEIGINYCSFHFKNRFQKAGYRNTIAREVMPGACITENGYIREFKGNTLCYQTIRLFNASTYPSNESVKIITIGGKQYAYILSRVFYDNGLSYDQQKSIHGLLESEPELPPANPLLFRIWQFEYIEKGLRSH